MSRHDYIRCRISTRGSLSLRLLRQGDLRVGVHGAQGWRSRLSGVGVLRVNGVHGWAFTPHRGPGVAENTPPLFCVPVPHRNHSNHEVECWKDEFVAQLFFFVLQNLNFQLFYGNFNMGNLGIRFQRLPTRPDVLS